MSGSPTLAAACPKKDCSLSYDHYHRSTLDGDEVERAREHLGCVVCGVPMGTPHQHGEAAA